MTDRTLTVDFAGEIFTIHSGESFTVGREGDLAIDDNPYLHRVFLVMEFHGDLWWVANAGSHLAATLTDRSGLMRSALAPGARVPLVFPESVVTFAAGSTAYELLLTTSVYDYMPQAHRLPIGSGTTINPTPWTPAQLLAILALAEPFLRRAGTGSAEVPSAVAAARRLGWTQTRFNRKLDNICDKLIAAGISGLRGVPGAGASNRRLQIVEYAVSTLLVTPADLLLLEEESRTNALAARAAAAASRAGENAGARPV